MLEPILSVTYGCIVYQEQVIEIFRRLAGYTLGQADMVRRAMSFTELMDCLPNGFKQMVPAILILCLAWTIGDVTKALGAPEFVADLVSKFGPGLKNFLPAVVFLIAAFLGFRPPAPPGGTFTILLPIVIPGVLRRYSCCGSDRG